MHAHYYLIASAISISLVWGQIRLRNPLHRPVFSPVWAPFGLQILSFLCQSAIFSLTTVSEAFQARRISEYSCMFVADFDVNK